MATAKPGHVVETAPSAELRGRLPVRSPPGRPASQATRSADHRQADPSAAVVPGADPRLAAGVHHVGPIPCQPGATRRQPGPARSAGRTAGGRLAAARPAAVRRVRAADDRAVRGPEKYTKL